MTKHISALLLILMSSLFLTNCGKDDPEIPNEEELITTLTYTLTPDDGSPELVMTFRDLDGDGEEVPFITGAVLTANKSYTGSLDLLNESVTPSERITDEIEVEQEDHQFFFQSDVPGLTVNYDDQDADENPLGLRTMLTTGEAGSGFLTIILRHEPNKSATGVSDGDISNAGGETDIEVTFPIDVQ